MLIKYENEYFFKLIEKDFGRYYLKIKIKMIKKLFLS